MDFLIKIQNTKLQAQGLREMQTSQEPALRIINSKVAFKAINYSFADCEFFLFGDIIFPEEIASNSTLQAKFIKMYSDQKKLYQLKGFFYIIILNYDSNSVNIFSCFLNILPVYYCVLNDVILVSGSLFAIYEDLESKPLPNETYVIEKTLFNYSFLNNTPFENIFLMPSCHYIDISKDRLKTTKYYSIDDLIVEKPKPWRKNLETLSNIYSKELLASIPDQLFALTLTGGFDGRTVLSSALKSKAEFKAFSYGGSVDPDILIPESISNTLGFHYSPFYLDDNYAIKGFWADAITFLMQSEGAGNLSRGHYVYTACELSKTHKYILTGNFGSEIIRSLKEPGVMASDTLFALFECENKKMFEDFVKTQKKLDFIHPDLLHKHLSAIVNEAWNYKQGLPHSFSINKKFYMYVFGEVFRKYFGAEIVVQSEYLINRSPFVHYNVFKATLETSIAGVYQKFKEKSPFKRFHGQILYAHVLKNLYPPLLNLVLDKGYKPKDFLSTAGRFSITSGYLKRKFSKKKKNLNPSYSENFYVLNFDKMVSLNEESNYLNKESIRSLLQSGDWKLYQQEIINALSMELFFQKKLN
jgi:asparagine synthase (glutamine-hydrolysing)